MAVKSVNEDLRDKIIRHQHWIERFKGGAVTRLLKVLRASEQDILAKIAKVDPTGTSQRYTEQRLNRLLGEIRDINAVMSSNLRDQIYEDVRGLGKYEAAFMTKLAKAVIPVKVDLISPNAEAVRAAVFGRPFNGRVLKDWVRDWEPRTFRRIQDALRMGVVQGETVDQLVRRVRGSQANGFRDGVLNINRAGAAALMRTAVNHTVDAARLATYEANSDVIKGEQWLATLDHRTCPTCGGLDGKEFELGKGPRPPAHVACRCVRVPVLKSWKELGINAKELPESTRASMDGQVPESLTYNRWLKDQPVSVQNEALGVSRAQLFRAGDLEVNDFTSPAGRLLSLPELARREADAFAKAGVDVAGNSLAQRKIQEAAFTAYLGQDRYDAILAEAKAKISKRGAKSYRLTDGELVAIYGYSKVEGGLYREINGLLRGDHRRESVRPAANVLENALRKLPVHTGYVERRTNLPDAVARKLAVGGELRDPAFMSSAAVKSRFQGKHVLRTISRNGRRIETLTEAGKREAEVLFPPGTRFKIISIDNEPDGAIAVSLKEMD